MQEYYIEKSSKDQNLLIKYPETKKIEGFQWGKEKEVLNFITLNIDSKENVKLWDMDQISSWSTTSLTQSQIFIAELYCGSYSDLFKINSDVREIREQIKSTIFTRIRIIIDMVKIYPLHMQQLMIILEKFGGFFSLKLLTTIKF